MNDEKIDYSKLYTAQELKEIFGNNIPPIWETFYKLAELAPEPEVGS